MKPSLFFFSLPLLMVSLHYSTTTVAQSPAIAPVKAAPADSAAAAPAVLVPALPQSPSDSTPDTASSTDIVGILSEAKSFNVFVRLLNITQLINQINSQLITTKSGGLTIFAPDDSAFSELKAGFLNSLGDAQKLELLQYHILPTYVTSNNFDTLTNPVRTLAGDKPGTVDLNVTSYGGSVNMSTGVVNTTVTGIVYTDKHLAIYKVGKVLLPLDFYASNTPTAAPALAPAAAGAKAPKADKDLPPSSEEDYADSSQENPSDEAPALAPAAAGAKAPKADKDLPPSSEEDYGDSEDENPGEEDSGDVRLISFNGMWVSLGVAFIAVFTA